jgi:hypothetical protein
MEDVERIEGLVQGIRRDTLFVLSTKSNDVIRVPWDQIRDLQVRRGSTNRALQGLGIGIGTGIVLGVALGTAMGDDFLFPSGDLAVILAAELGVVGGLIGLGIGSMVKTEGWESVSLPEMKPSLQVTPDGRLRVGFSVPLKR